mgnify:CR=1 FL=1
MARNPDRVAPYPPAKRRRRWWGIPRMTVKMVVPTLGSLDSRVIDGPIRAKSARW